MAWKGLTDETAIQIEAELCRVAHRTGRFAKHGEQGIVATLGALLDHLIQLVNTLQPSERVAKQEVAEALNVSTTQFAKLISGNVPSKSADKWAERAARAFRFVLSGGKNGEALASREVVQRIDKYFFFGDGNPRYFESKRIASPDCWTDRELAAEIRAFAHFSKSAAMGEKGRMWLITGDVPFTEGDNKEVKDIPAAVSVAIDGGVEIMLVAPENGDSLQQSAQVFCDQVQRQVKYKTGSQQGPGFFTCCTRYLFLDGPNGETNTKSLWLLRPPFQDDTAKTTPTPLAYAGRQAEAVAMANWLKGLKGLSGSEIQLSPARLAVNQPDASLSSGSGANAAAPSPASDPGAQKLVDSPPADKSGAKGKQQKFGSKKRTRG